MKHYYGRSGETALSVLNFLEERHHGVVYKNLRVDLLALS